MVLNATFYTHIARKQYDQIAFGHPAIYRALINAFIATDLAFALAFAYLYARAGVALGGGATAGMKLDLIVAVLSHYWAGLPDSYVAGFSKAACVIRFPPRFPTRENGLVRVRRQPIVRGAAVGSV